MNRNHKLLIAFSVVLAVFVGGCPEEGENHEELNSDKSTVTRGEHGGESRGEHDRDRQAVKCGLEFERQPGQPGRRTPGPPPGVLPY